MRLNPMLQANISWPRRIRK